MNKVFKWLKAIWLFPVFLLLGVDGDGGTLLGGGGASDDGGIDDGGNSDAAGDNGDDLSTLFTSDEITAKKESLATLKAEEDRRAALTQEERDAEDAKKADEESKNKVPEEYADFKMPEGMEVAKDLLELAIPLFKESKLTQEQAQKFIDLNAQMVQKRTEAWSNIVADWGEQTKSDKEYGGEKFDESKAIVKKSIDAFSTPALKEALNQYGLGNHPEMFRLFYKIGKAISEDKVVLPGATPASAENQIKNMYSNSNMN